jgi:hypothetical protein
MRAERQGLILGRHAVLRRQPRGDRLGARSPELERTNKLNLTVKRDKAHEYTTRLTSLVTALAMNFLYTDKFFETD